MKWEYPTLECRNHKVFEESANEYGQHGWELVHVFQTSGFTIGFFKRPSDYTK